MEYSAVGRCDQNCCHITSFMHSFARLCSVRGFCAGGLPLQGRKRDFAISASNGGPGQTDRRTDVRGRADGRTAELGSANVKIRAEEARREAQEKVGPARPTHRPTEEGRKGGRKQGTECNNEGSEQNI